MSGEGVEVLVALVVLLLVILTRVLRLGDVSLVRELRLLVVDLTLRPVLLLGLGELALNLGSLGLCLAL